MKTIKTYNCEGLITKCGEAIFEDDIECPNCRKKVDKRKFKKMEIAEITKEKLFDPELVIKPSILNDKTALKAAKQYDYDSNYNSEVVPAFLAGVLWADEQKRV